MIFHGTWNLKVWPAYKDPSTPVQPSSLHLTICISHSLTLLELFQVSYQIMNSHFQRGYSLALSDCSHGILHPSDNPQCCNYLSIVWFPSDSMLCEVCLTCAALYPPHQAQWLACSWHSANIQVERTNKGTMRDIRGSDGGHSSMSGLWICTPFSGKHHSTFLGSLFHCDSLVILFLGNYHQGWGPAPPEAPFQWGPQHPHKEPSPHVSCRPHG